MNHLFTYSLPSKKKDILSMKEELGEKIKLLDKKLLIIEKEDENLKDIPVKSPRFYIYGDRSKEEVYDTVRDEVINISDSKSLHPPVIYLDRYYHGSVLYDLKERREITRHVDVKNKHKDYLSFINKDHKMYYIPKDGEIHNIGLCDYMIKYDRYFVLYIENKAYLYNSNFEKEIDQAYREIVYTGEKFVMFTENNRTILYNPMNKKIEVEHNEYLVNDIRSSFFYNSKNIYSKHLDLIKENAKSSGEYIFDDNHVYDSEGNKLWDRVQTDIGISEEIPFYINGSQHLIKDFKQVNTSKHLDNKICSYYKDYKYHIFFYSTGAVIKSETCWTCTSKYVIIDSIVYNTDGKKVDEIIKGSSILNNRSFILIDDTHLYDHALNLIKSEKDNISLYKNVIRIGDKIYDNNLNFITEHIGNLNMNNTEVFLNNWVLCFDDNKIFKKRKDEYFIEKD